MDHDGVLGGHDWIGHDWTRLDWIGLDCGNRGYRNYRYRLPLAERAPLPLLLTPPRGGRFLRRVVSCRAVAMRCCVVWCLRRARGACGRSRRALSAEPWAFRSFFLVVCGCGCGCGLCARDQPISCSARSCGRERGAISINHYFLSGTSLVRVGDEGGGGMGGRTMFGIPFEMG